MKEWFTDDVCGDFNRRCDDLDDFIRGIDKVCDRKVIYFSLNKYGEILIDFLLIQICAFKMIGVAGIMTLLLYLQLEIQLLPTVLLNIQVCDILVIFQ